MEAIQSFDLSVLNAIQNSLKCGFLDFFAVFISYLTTSGIIWIVTGVILLFFRKTRAVGIIVLVALALGFLSGDVLLKHLVNRPRPFTVNTDIALLIKQPSGASFPFVSLFRVFTSMCIIRRTFCPDYYSARSAVSQLC